MGHFPGNFLRRGKLAWIESLVGVRIALMVVGRRAAAGVFVCLMLVEVLGSYGRVTTTAC